MAAAAKVFRQRIDDFLAKGQAYEAQQLMLTVINRLIARNALDDARETIFSYTETLCNQHLWNAAAEVASLCVRILERTHARDSQISEDDLGLATSLFDCFSPLFAMNLDDDASEVRVEADDNPEVEVGERGAKEHRHLPHVVFISSVLSWTRTQTSKAWAAFDKEHPELPNDDPHAESRQSMRDDYARRLALIEAQLHTLIAQAYAYAALKGPRDGRDKFAKLAEDSYTQALLPTDHGKFLSKLLAPHEALHGDAGDVLVEIRKRQIRFSRAALVYIARGNLKCANTLLTLYRQQFPGDAPELSEINPGDNTNVIEFVVLLVKLCEYDAAPLFKQLRELYEPALCTPAAADSDVSGLLDLIATRYFDIPPPKSMLDSALSLFGL